MSGAGRDDTRYRREIAILIAIAALAALLRGAYLDRPSLFYDEVIVLQLVAEPGPIERLIIARAILNGCSVMPRECNFDIDMQETTHSTQFLSCSNRIQNFALAAFFGGTGSRLISPPLRLFISGAQISS